MIRSRLVVTGVLITRLPAFSPDLDFISELILETLLFSPQEIANPPGEVRTDRDLLTKDLDLRRRIA